ncbi:MAG: phage/plasmid primase, P4 family [Nitrospira sp.]|nr:phage/plasmid primase, P4 family [Nitrospira sp.]
MKQKQSKAKTARPNKKSATLQQHTVEAALQYLEQGWSVIPLRAGGKESLVPWKDYQTTSATQKQVRDWWKECPEANVGVITGRVSGLVVIDIDGEEGEATLAQLEFTHGALPQTRTVRTGNGRHLYFNYPGRPIQSSAGTLGKGVDVRADGGYVVAPPSMHQNGTRYCWTSAVNQGLAELPSWLQTELISGSINTTTRIDQVEGIIHEGHRNDAMTRLAGALRRQGFEESMILTALQAENQSRCVPPLPQAELESIARSVAGYPCVTDQAPHSDLGNARRLIAAHGRDLLYCNHWGKWLVWDGARWSVDQKDHVTRLAKETLSKQCVTAARSLDAENKNLATHLLRSQSVGHIHAMVDLAKCEPGIPVSPDELDADPWLLAVCNGTVDLRTGELKVARREDRITKSAPVIYEPKACCPTWEKFLSRVFEENAELIRYVQQAIGYSLTGSTQEQVLFVLYGTGANGKSTLLNTVSALLGEYARQTSADTLLVKRGDSISNDIARLQGARFVSAVEAEQGRSLAEALVKRLTGGDKLSARFLYGEYFEFVPSFKLWLGVNHKPNIRGTDEAIWRRIRVIPFAVTIPPEERDKNLGDKLHAELPGILNWAIEGCLDWQQHGLRVPEDVQCATDTYREEMDVLETFLRECCLEDRRSCVSIGGLYAAYATWCSDNAEYQLNKRDFSTRLKERGLEQGRTSQERCWVGIALKQEQRW